MWRWTSLALFLLLAACGGGLGGGSGTLSLAWITAGVSDNIFWDSTVAVPVAKLANCWPDTPPSSGSCTYFTVTVPTNPIPASSAPAPCWAIGV